jgi:hypothetical protein
MTLAGGTKLGPYEIPLPLCAGVIGRSGVMLLALLLLAGPALAQFGGESVGHLYGKVADEQGAVLPGVTVTLSGVGAPATAMTNSGGEFRFLNLAPGTYTLKLELSSFATVNHENVVVKLGRNTEITESLKLASVAATVTVTGEAPLIDTKNVQTGAVITQTELQSIPTARDPWVLLQSVPGVTLDRVNVAGSESGQQSTFVSKGSVAGWFVVDGINVTNMEVLGASLFYYDFDTFQEVQVITGGSDPTIQGPGAHINMTTKRGTNQVHGSARVYDVNDSFESTNYPPTDGRRSIQSLQDYGIETGGPIIQDHVWLWGAYGRNQLNIAVGSSLPPLTTDATLENLNGKLDWQVIPSNAFELVGQHSNKLVFGRGAGPLRPQATTFDQTLPQTTWKVQDSQVAGANLFFSAMYAGQNGTFVLTPEGHGQLSYNLGQGYMGTAPYFLTAGQRERQAKADATYFFNTGSLGHELKAGFQYLKASEFATTGIPGYPIAGDPNECLKCGSFLITYGSLPVAGIFRDRAVAFVGQYYGIFFSDTLTLDRLTVQVGARWDEQYGTNLPSTVAANPSYPTILPAINYPGSPRPFTWNNWTPRIGITYALGAKHETVLKASYARFVDALGIGTVGLTSPLGSSAGAYYPWTDTNHNGIVDVGEVCTTCPLLKNSYGYNPASPGNSGTPSNLINPNLKPGKTSEFLVGVDKEILPGLAAGITYTYRKYTLPIYGLPYDAATGTILKSGDYTQYGVLTPGSPLCNGPCPALPNGAAYSVPVYDISPAVFATLSGSYYTNRTNYNQTYSGVDFTVTKRLSDKWMVRANFTYAANKQNVGANGCSGDPNNGNTYQPPYGFMGATCRNGDYVSVQSTGSGSHYSAFLNSKYVYNLNTLYQLPLGFNLAAAFFGRQGYPINYYVLTTGSDDGRTRAIAVTPTDAFRYPGLYELDLRLEKVIPFAKTAAVTVAVDAFNITNHATILQEENNISASNARQVFEVQNPRVFRFGARISF